MVARFCSDVQFARASFPSHIVTKLPFLNVLCASQELQYHTMQKRRDHYGASGGSAEAAGYSHFQCIVMQS